MDETPFTYYPVDEAWQYAICQALELEYGKPNGCLPGEPTRQLTTPATSFHIEGDGACFFRSLSHLITGSQSQHLAIRQKVCNHMLRERVSEWLARRGFSNQRDTDIPVTDSAAHIARTNMRNPTAWATDTELYAASDLLGTQIITADNSVWALYNSRRFGIGDFVRADFSIYLNYVPFSGKKDNACNHYEVVRSIV